MIRKHNEWLMDARLVARRCALAAGLLAACSGCADGLTATDESSIGSITQGLYLPPAGLYALRFSQFLAPGATFPQLYFTRHQIDGGIRQIIRMVRRRPI